MLDLSECWFETLLWLFWRIDLTDWFDRLINCLVILIALLDWLSGPMNPSNLSIKWTNSLIVSTMFFFESINQINQNNPLINVMNHFKQWINQINECNLMNSSNRSSQSIEAIKLVKAVMQSNRPIKYINQSTEIINSFKMQSLKATYQINQPINPSIEQSIQSIKLI